MALNVLGTELVACSLDPLTGFFRDGWGRKLMPPEMLAALEEAYGRWGTAGIFLSRFLPGLRAAVPPFAGVAGLSPARALVPAAVASAVWYAFLGSAGYALAQKEFGAKPIDGGPWCSFRNPKSGRDITVKDVIADAFLQQILLRPAEYSVIATLNLNGDYISDALAAQVGGIGIAPGANLSDTVAMFEATHGTAPKYAGKDYVNPGSEILSAEMMLRHMGWTAAADLIIASMERSIASKKVTYDFARLMEGATQVSCSGFGQVMIDAMN